MHKYRKGLNDDFKIHAKFLNMTKMRHEKNIKYVNIEKAEICNR